MSPLSNHTNNNANSTNSSSLSALNSNNNSSSAINSNQTNSSNSAFKPLINENRQLNMLSTSGPITTTSTDHYNELATYGGYTHHHHHHHLNSQLHSAQDYLSSHQTLPLGVYKSDHDDLTGYGFARPVKLYEHGSSIDSANTSANGNSATNNSTGLINSYSPSNNGNNGSSTAASATNSGSGTSGSSTFRSDAPSPGASIIDLSTSSVTSLRTHGNGALANGFPNGTYYDGQRYDRSPQSASSPHYSSPQMLSPQGQTLDLSVGRTR